MQLCLYLPLGDVPILIFGKHNAIILYSNNYLGNIMLLYIPITRPQEAHWGKRGKNNN